MKGYRFGNEVREPTSIIIMFHTRELKYAPMLPTYYIIIKHIILYYNIMYIHGLVQVLPLITVAVRKTACIFNK